MAEKINSAAAQQLAGHALGVSVTIMLSRVFGLWRDIFLVFFFGATAWILDAFYFAFTIPNLLRNLLGEGALTAAFVPEFMREREKSNGGKLSSAILTLLFIVTGAITIGGALLCYFSTQIITLSEKINLTLALLAIMLPFATLICCSAIMGAILQSTRVFILPAVMSCLLNLAMMIAMLIYGFNALPTDYTDFAQWKNILSVELNTAQLITMIKAVGWSVIIAGAAQLLLQYLAIRARGVPITLTRNFRDDALKKVMQNFLPAAAGLGVVQVNALLDNLLAYTLSLGFFGTICEGATTYLFLGNRLMQLPLGVFTIALATTAFPTFSALAAQNNHAELTKTLFASLRNLWFIMLPSAFGLIVLSTPIVVLLYQNVDMQFSPAAVYRTSAVLVCFALALPFFSAIHLFTRTFYALGDYRTPVKIAMQTVGLNIVGNLLLMHLPDYYLIFTNTKIAGLPNALLNEAGLALSTTICAGINCYRLWSALGKRLPETWREETKTFFGAAFSQLISALGMAVGTYFVLRSVAYAPELIYRIERVGCAIFAAIMVYSIFASTFCGDDYERFMSRIRRKRKK